MEVLQQALQILARGRFIYDQSLYQEALALFQQALEQDPKQIQAHLGLASLLQGQNRNQETLYCVQQAHTLMPDNEVVLLNLANAYRGAGDKQEAIKTYKQVLGLNDMNLAAHMSLMNLGAHAAYQDEAALDALLAQWQVLHTLVQKLQSQASLVDPAHKRLAHDFNTLAQTLFCFFDKQNKYDRAYAYLKAGSDFYRKSLVYSSLIPTQQLAALKKVFTKDIVQKLKDQGDKSKSPIFVLGMPRSGSSLIEQILAAHSLVKGLGELYHLKQVTLGPEPLVTASELGQNILTWDEQELKSRGAAYIKYMQEHLSSNYSHSFGDLKATKAQEAHFVDKMPANLFLVGYIKLLLPNAKIICTKRDRMDTCWSTYKNFFEGSQPFSYDFEEALEYYDVCEELRVYWQEIFGDEIFELDYKELIQDQEGQSRALLEYCELEWEPQCLEFYKNQDSVRTVSEDQVKQEIYDSSLGAWQKYQEYLQV